VIEAVKQGFWNFEPAELPFPQAQATDAVPGSEEKVAVLARRLEEGLPLWHPADRAEGYNNDLT
jgi:hypothetical protein